MPPTYPSRLDRLMQAWRDRALARKAFSFALIGAVNAAVDFTVFSCAFYIFELPIVAANLCAWGVAVSSSYVLNSMFTFAAESGRKLTAKTYAGLPPLNSSWPMANGRKPCGSRATMMRSSAIQTTEKAPSS